MTLALSVLGSGSSGNSTLVSLNGCTAPRHILIDAGLSPRMTAKRLAPFGIALDDISHILFTHLDHDHFRPTWLRAAERHDITLHIHRRQRSRAQREGWSFAQLALFDDRIDLEAETTIDTVSFAHDQLGTVGFLIEHAGARLGFATDLGRVPPWLYETFADLDALAIESNYDRAMQVASARPPYLKRRIMGGTGHLSNEQSLDAVLRIADQSSLSRIALLHLSRQCNCPKLVASLYADRAAHLAPIVTVTDQFEPTPLLAVVRATGARKPKPGRAPHIETLLPFFTEKEPARQ